MILEQATLHVRSGREDDFVAAFGEAKAIIAAMPGFLGLTLSRCVERDGLFLLLVRWETLEHHTEGFRGSPQYQEWRRALHHFYDPFPEVLHFEDVDRVDIEAT